jgi:hypothetical protein
VQAFCAELKAVTAGAGLKQWLELQRTLAHIWARVGVTLAETGSPQYRWAARYAIACALLHDSAQLRHKTALNPSSAPSWPVRVGSRSSPLSSGLWAKGTPKTCSRRAPRQVLSSRHDYPSWTSLNMPCDDGHAKPIWMLDHRPNSRMSQGPRYAIRSRTSLLRQIGDQQPEALTLHPTPSLHACRARGDRLVPPHRQDSRGKYNARRAKLRGGGPCQRPPSPTQSMGPHLIWCSWPGETADTHGRLLLLKRSCHGISILGVVLPY